MNEKLIQLEKNEMPEILKTFNKIPLIFNLVTALLQMYFLPAIETKYIWNEQLFENQQFKTT